MGEAREPEFNFNDAPGAEIRISFDPNDGAWSYVGTDCRSIPLNEATMNLGFMDGGTTAHEFGHAIGLAHEHQNPAGGIQWNEEVVIRELAKSPNFWDEATTRHNVLRKYTADQINGTGFDPDSIMLYFFPAEWTLNGIGTKANEVLSALDKEFVAGAKMYPKTGPTVDAPSSSRSTRPAHGRVDRQVRRRGSVRVRRHEGRPARDRHQGSHRRRDEAFGPDNPTALIAEDDDSGVDYNARIAADLIKGRYFVQVRHYNRASGMGKYSVRVSRA